MKKKSIPGITIILFIGCIFLGTVLNLILPKQTFSYEENRTLASFPSTDINNLLSGDFDDGFEKWFADHFFGRRYWIETKAASKVATGFIDNNDVYFGKHNALIRKFQTYSSKTVDQNCDIIKEFIDEQDINTAIMIVPTAAYCNKQEVPLGAYNLDQEALLSSIQKKIGVGTFLPSLHQVSDANQHYFKTDHHWNEKGSYLGYLSICENFLNKQPEKFTTTLVSDSFYGTMYSRSGAFWRHPDSIYRIDPNTPFHATVTMEDGSEHNGLYFDERLQEKDQYMYYLDGNHPYIRIETDVKNGKKAILVKDSYAHILIPYLACEYQEIELVDLRYYRQPVSSLIQDKEHTDLYFIYSLDNFCEDPNIAFLR